MSQLFQTYKRQPVEFVKAEGVYLIDTTNKRYLDFTSGIGVTNLAFHPAVQQTVNEQVNAIWHSPNLYENHLQEKVASLLIEKQDYLAFFCNSGAEANEAALKLARKATGKQGVITFWNSFHGRTFGAMTATGQKKIQEGFGDLVPHISYATYNDINSVLTLADDQTAAVLIELVQGESGIYPADISFVKELARFCQERGILLIVDEVQTGMGRTGKLFSYQHYGIEPDIITLAKGLANGLPVGAMLGKLSLSSAFGYGSHGSTFGGNKVAMAAALETLKVMTAPGFLSTVEKQANSFASALKEALEGVATVTAIRSLGYMVGIETTAPLTSIVDQCREAGLLVLTAGKDVIRLLPPLVLTSEQQREGIAILQEVFKKV